MCETKSTNNTLTDLGNTRIQNHGGYQNALVDVSIADTLHADPDDARVSNLFVVDGQHGLRGAAGRWRVGVQNQRRRAEVRMWGAAGGAGKTGGGGGRGAGGEILCNIVKRAWERLREGRRGKILTPCSNFKPMSPASKATQQQIPVTSLIVLCF